MTKISHDLYFYLGAMGGYFLTFTGISPEQLSSIMVIIFLDMATRVWAEVKNKRAILSRKMWYGFAGKASSYLILLIFANHAFIGQDILSYIILGGFTLVEFRSVYENLKDAGQAKHISVVGEKIESIIEQKFDGIIEEKRKVIDRRVEDIPVEVERRSGEDRREIEEN